jgi:predicted nucleic acid-binding protein
MTIAYPSDDIVISDANVLINFLDSGNLDVLLQVFKGKLHITDVVQGEIKNSKTQLQKAIEEKIINVHRVPVDKVAHLVKSFYQFHAGEASCFLLAKEKGWCIATDDSAAKAHITKELGSFYIITTFDIILKAVRLES